MATATRITGRVAELHAGMAAQPPSEVMGAFGREQAELAAAGLPDGMASVGITSVTYQSELLVQLIQRGITLVAVSPQAPDGSLSMAEKNALTFTSLRSWQHHRRPARHPHRTISRRTRRCNSDWT